MSVLKIKDDTHLHLPKEMLRSLGIGVGDEVEVELDEDRLVVRKRAASGVEALKACRSNRFEGYAEDLENERDRWDR